MPGTRSTRRRAAPAALAALVAALSIAACGSSSTAGTAADPATVVPADAPLYVSAVVQPEGTLKQNATADAKALTHNGKPFSSLLSALQGSKLLGHFDYAREVKPWLGPNAGLYVASPAALAHAGEALTSSLSGGLSAQSLLSALEGARGLQGALVLDTTSVSGARSFLAKLARTQGAHQTRYRGVAYDLDQAGVAEGIVGRFAVIGSASALRSVIDTHAGAPSLAKGAGPYRTLTSKSAPGTLLSVYASASASSSMQPLLALLPEDPKGARISVVPGSGSVALNADLLSSESGARQAGAAAASAAQMVQQLPSASWLATGVGDGGAHVAAYLSTLRSVARIAGSTVLSNFGGAALGRLADDLYAHRAALQSAFSGWAGPAAAFAAGTNLFSLQAGLVMRSSAAARSRAAVSEVGVVLGAAGATVRPASIPGTEAAIAARLPGFPAEIDVAAGEGRFAVGLGPASIEAALAPGATLAGSPLYNAASKALGGKKPVAIFELSALTGLIEGLGLQESSSLAPAMPYLRSLGLLAAGEQALGGGITRIHAVLSLQRGG